MSLGSQGNSGHRFVAGMNGSDGGKRRKETEKSDLIRKRNRLNSSFFAKNALLSLSAVHLCGWHSSGLSGGDRERERERLWLGTWKLSLTAGRTERTPIEESGGVGPDNPFQTQGLFRHARIPPVFAGTRKSKIGKTRISQVYEPPLSPKRSSRGHTPRRVVSSPTLARFPFPGEI